MQWPQGRAEVLSVSTDPDLGPNAMQNGEREEGGG